MHNLPDKNISISITSGTIIKTLLILVAGAAIYYFWDIVLVLLMAVVIASAVEPATKWFTRFKVPRIVSVLVIYLSAAFFLSGILFFFRTAPCK